MTEKYYRLVTILVNICPGPLRELFLKHAKTDPKSKAPYTTLDAYLFSRKKDVIKLKSKQVLRQHQYDLLYPPSPGQADLNTWDVTLLSLMLTELFKQKLQSTDISCIDVINGIRNDLQHISGTCQITNSEFDNAYKQLLSNTSHLAASAKGQAYSDAIEADIKKVEACVLIDLGNVLRQWYMTEKNEIKDSIQDQKVEMVQLKDEIKEIKDDTTQTRQTIKKGTVKRAGRGGKMSKRFKTENHILDKMKGNFVALMRHEKNTDFQSPPEFTRITKELDENHLVVVSGYGKCLYQQTALSVIERSGYTEDRCVVVSFPSDWRHFDPEDVDLAVFLNPFGKGKFDEDKARSMKGILDSINDSTKHSTTSADDTIDVMIITDQSILDECKTHFNHDVIENPVIVYKPTTEDSPVELVDSENPGCSVSTDPHYRNLLVQSIAYCKHHKMQLVDRSILEEAQELFRLKKVIVISGPRGSGKTTLALSLLSSYQEGHYLILTEPGDMSHIRFGATCVVVIEDLGGKYLIELPVIQQWLRKFDMLYSAIKEGKMNVIITCDMERLHACMIDASKHPILNSVIKLKKSGNVKVKLESSTEVYPGTSFSNSDKDQRLISFTGVKKIKNVAIPHPENLEWADFCQYIDGSYMFVTEQTYENEMESLIGIHHFSSDFHDIHQYQIDVRISDEVHPCICCTDTGELVLNLENEELRLYRITDGTIHLVKSKTFPYLCRLSDPCFTMNRILLLAYETDVAVIEILDKRLNKMKTIPLFESPNEINYTVVPMLNQMFVYFSSYNDVFFEDKRQKQLKYLREEGYTPFCICAAGEDSVFVLGIQDTAYYRILQVNTDVEILADILLDKDELPWKNINHVRKNCIEFDSSNSRLVLFQSYSNMIYEIHLM